MGLLLWPAASGLVAIAAVTDEQLKAVADFAAVVLALLTFFTAWRATKLAEDLKAIGSFGLGTAGQLAIDGVLALVTFLACAAMASPFSESWTWSFDRWTKSSHVLQSLFSVIYLGFALVFVAQLGLIFGRLIPSLVNSFAGGDGGEADPGSA